MPDRKPDSQPADPAWERISAPNCSWGAAPFWHPQQERVYWVDRVQNRIWRLHLPSGRTEMWQLEQTPGCLSPCRSGALLLALRDGIYLSQAWHDIAQRIVNAPYDTARQRFHEGCCDPWGRLWIDTRIDEGRTGRADLYCLHKLDRPNPELLRLLTGRQEAAGLAWSPDGRRLHWGDSASGRIDRYPLTSAGLHPPVLGPPLGFAQLPLLQDGQAISGRPQGAAIDSAGRYWLALADGGCVVCLGPDGQLLARIPTPAQRPTGLCFGGPDLRTLFLTTARAGLDRAGLERHPGSGALFALRVDLPGRPVTPYED